MSSGRIVALDLGTRRIGVAVSDELRLSARALGVIPCVGPRRDAAALRELIAGLDVSLLVVGLPALETGVEGSAAERARRSGADLARRLQLDVEFVDEAGTTLEAQELLRREHASSRRRKRDVDAIAAVLILERFLAESA